MQPAPVDALVETAAVDGIAFDGLHVATGTSGYLMETPGGTHGGLSEAQLREVAEGSPYVHNWYFWHAVAPQREDHWTFLRWLEELDIPTPVAQREQTRASSDQMATRSVQVGSGRTEEDETGEGIRKAGPQKTGPPDRVERRERQTPADLSSHYETLEEGIETTWGEVLVTVTLDDESDRQYHLSHVEDRTSDAATLERYDRPRALRAVARFDDRGRYRPLVTAPTLQTGWLTGPLDPAECLRALGVLYPATVENWYLERSDALDVTHWRETIDRQTGIYGVVQTWNRGAGHDHVERVARTCCADSECLKRRRWQYDADTELDANEGSGEFPCREPCSLVIAAARTWTRLEGEQPRTYEVELTPGEKAQLETIVDAVADGRTAEIREGAFDDGANRWRVRYLREKLFDDDGIRTTTQETCDGEPCDGPD